MYSTIRIDVALPRVRARNILQLFKTLSTALAHHTGLPEQLFLEELVEKEAESSSAIGGGVAIPHMQSPAIRQRTIILATLERPIHMEAPDNRNVDLVCVLLSPESDGPIHLRGLSRLSRLMKNEEMCQLLRETKDAEAIKGLFINPDGWLIAA